MEQIEFKRQFQECTNLLLEKYKDAYKEIRYDLTLNESYDLPYNYSKFDYYPEDEGQIIRSVTFDEAVTVLYRNGKIPIWIDIYVSYIEKQVVVLELLCAGRYTNDGNELYYREKGTGAFGLKIKEMIS